MKTTFSVTWTMRALLRVEPMGFASEAQAVHLLHLLAMLLVFFFRRRRFVFIIVVFLLFALVSLVWFAMVSTSDVHNVLVILVLVVGQILVLRNHTLHVVACNHGKTLLIGSVTGGKSPCRKTSDREEDKPTVPAHVCSLNEPVRCENNERLLLRCLPVVLQLTIFV